MRKLDKLYKSDVPHRAKLVYLYLFDRMDKTRMAWPAIGTMVKELSLARSTVKRALDDLVQAELIQIKPHYRENGSATSN